MRLTQKQHWIMALIMKGHVNEAGVRYDWLDISELIPNLPYKTSRDSLQFSIRCLIEKGLIERQERILRRERWVSPLAPTETAFELLRPRRNLKLIEHDNDVIEERF